MASLVTLKSNVNTVIRTEAAAGGITPADVSAILDSIIDEIKERGILWVANYTAVSAVDPNDSKNAGDISTGNIYRHNGSTWVLINQPSLGSGGGSPVTLTTPSPLTVTPNGASGDTVLDISWANVSGETSYQLEFSLNGSTGWTQIGGTIAANTTTYQHTGRTASTPYYYRVKAVGDGVTYLDSGYASGNGTTNAGGSGYEAETDAFLAVNTGLSTTIKDALDALVVTMKAIGWSKFKAVYPLVGGSAAAHKWNLVNPADTDAAFRLTFVGSHTHNANGITPGGTTADYANTHFVPNTEFATANSAAIGYYIRSITGDHALMGAYEDTVSYYDTFQLQTYSGSFYGQIGMVTDSVTTPSPFTRLIIGSRTGATTTDFYRDGTNFKSSTLSYDKTCGVPIFLFGRNAAGTNDAAGSVPCSFAFMSDGLTSGEVATFNTAVNTFQTAIGRNV